MTLVVAVNVVLVPLHKAAFPAMETLGATVGVTVTVIVLAVASVLL